ncbi:MAG: hypothetical protein HY238_27805 [Acidobacteria bacterium]|nr:hypothetical protein [Acidobacteriota bacterium]
MPHRLTRWGLGLAAGLCLAQAPEGPRILRPADQSALPAGPLSVIARGDEKSQLLLDGKPLEAKRPFATVLTATLAPASGPHTLTLATAGAEQKVQFFAGPKPPAGFQPYRPHPPAAATCDTCHAVKDGEWGFKGTVLSENCFGCHNQKTFATKHSHNEETLAECQLCHDPHGSTEKFHLKMTREIACKQCHG